MIPNLKRHLFSVRAGATLAATNTKTCLVMLRHTLTTLIFFAFYVFCFGQYNVEFGQQNGAEKVYEVESCDGVTGMYIGWHPSSYGFGNGRMFYGIYNLADGQRGEVDAYPSSDVLELSGSLVNVEFIAYRRFSDGPCSGYAAAITLQSGRGRETLRLLRFDLGGNLLTETNTTAVSGTAGSVHGLLYSNAGSFIAVGSFQDASSPSRPAIFEYNGSNGELIKTALLDYDFDNDGAVDGFEARDIVELSNSRTSAQYAVACRAANTTSIIGLDVNFIPVAGYTYDIDGVPNPEVPDAMVELDGVLYIAGSAPGKGTLVALNAVGSNTEALFNHRWTVDLFARGGGLTIKDIDRSATEGVVLAGWSSPTRFPGLTTAKGLLILVDARGRVQSTTVYNTASLDNFHVLDVDYIPRLNGHIATGWGNVSADPLNLRQRLILTDNQLSAPCVERSRVISKQVNPRTFSGPVTSGPSRVRAQVTIPPSLQNLRLQRSFACSQTGCTAIEEVCKTGLINVTTGYDQSTGQTSGYQSPDAEWVMTQSPDPSFSAYPFPSQTIAPDGGWDLTLDAPDDKGAWISPYGTAALTTDNTIPYVFERCFCLCDDDTVRFDMATAVDDLLDLELWEKDGNQITTLQSFNTGWKFHTTWPFTETVSLTAGSYCLKANVFNDGGIAMGFYATGTISSPSLVEDACCQDSFIVAGIKVTDSNCSGRTEVNGGNVDQGLADSPITILQQGTQNVVWTGTTDQNGYFSATLPAGSYDVVTSTVAPSMLTTPTSGTYSFDLSYDQPAPFVVFGETDPENCDCLFSSATTIASDANDACCYRIDFDNRNGLYYESIELTTGGGSIASISTTSPYQATLSAGVITVENTTQGQPLIGTGKFSIEVCLENMQPSQTMTVNWIKSDTSVCQDIDLISCGCAITATATQNDTNSPQDSCCTASVSFDNAYMQGFISKVDFELVFPSLESTYIDAFSLDAAAGYEASDVTTTGFTLTSATGAPFPSGQLDDVISFCFGDSLYTTNAQFVELTYYDEKCNPIVNCTDTLEFTCETVPIETELCTTIDFLSASCNPDADGLQTVSILVSNYTGNEITEVKVYSLFPPLVENVDFSATPITATTDGSGTATISFNVPTGGLSLPTSIPLYVTVHAPGAPGLNCCTREVLIDLEPCCDPCSINWLTVSPERQDSCCTEITIENSCDNELRKVTATVLSQGAVMNSIAINNAYSDDWEVGNNSGTNYIEAHFTTDDYAPAGVYQNLFSFCLRDTVGNGIEMVQIDYVGEGVNGDTILCSEVIEVFCEREPECLAVVSDTVYCDTEGNYYLDLTFVNNSYPAFTGDILFTETESSGTTTGLGIAPPLSSNIGMLPNGTHLETYSITGNPQQGDQLLLSTSLQSAFGQSLDSCCYDDNLLTITIPECIDDCCRDYEKFYQAVAASTGTTAQCDTARLGAFRLDSCMFATVDWGDGTFSNYQGSFTGQHIYNQDGNYNVCVQFGESLDGGQTFCWERQRCDSIYVEACSPTPTPFCDTLNQPMTRYFGWAAVTSSAYDDSTFPPGYNGNDYVLGLIDIRNHSSAPLGSNWGTASVYHGPTNNEWTADKLGDVFGLALDQTGNIYTSFFGLYSSRNQSAATQNFGSPALNPSQRPTIYRIDPVSGQVVNIGHALSLTHSIGAEGIYLGYGNVAYNAVNNALWVTHLSENKLYALDPTTGAEIFSYDPFENNVSAGRVFGIGYNPTEHRIYFSIWRQNLNNVYNGNNEIYSIGLTSSGNIQGLPVLEWEATSYHSSKNYSNPALDISFSTDGSEMLVSERTLRGLPGNVFASWAHSSRHLRFLTTTPLLASTNWTLDSSDPYKSVAYLGRNSAGGGDYTYDGPKFDSCDAIVLLSEDLIKPTANSSLNVYGIRGVDTDGGTVADSWFVDLDGNINQEDKYQVGDVEVFRELCCTSRPAYNACDDEPGWDARRAGFRVDYFDGNKIASLYWVNPIINDMVDIDWGDGTVTNNIWPSDFPVRHVYETRANLRLRARFTVVDANGDVCLETTESFEVTPVSEIAGETKILVYPNPFSNQLRISSKGLNAEITAVTLHNMTGQEMSVFHLQQGFSEHVLNTEGLAPGMYVVRARLSDGSVASSMVVHLE